MAGLAAGFALFLSAFVAATIIPAQSESVLTGLILADQLSTVLLVTIASVGNIAGSVVNWGLGRGVDRFSEARWFPVKKPMLDRATRWYHRYGRWSLLLSWAPIIGDPLTVVAGVLREPLWRFLLLVSIAKTGRYVFLAYAVSVWAGYNLASGAEIGKH
uniref:YqaA family protein n=1 Tax=Pararhizobium sp. IMCC3301 TaxID=3067904 RepID=UPI002741357E|nr:YqaA family protein [Pararhizobium sp. IMCC3301]